MNRLSIQKRAQILGLLVEGNSMRATSRLADCSMKAVVKLLVDLGRAVLQFQDKAYVNLPCTKIQVDEIWSFCYAKEKNVATTIRKVAGIGDVWTWTAICPDTKIVPTWYVGNRDLETAKKFLTDLASRMKNRIQLTSDGFNSYPEAVYDAFGDEVDYGMFIKIYGGFFDKKNKPERKYSSTKCVGFEKKRISGNPDPGYICTNAVERQNLTMRMSIRRYTRLTNGFSKKIENHAYAVAIHFMYYNFGRIHKTLKVTPAMEAGIADHVWSLEEIVALMDEKN